MAGSAEKTLFERALLASRLIDAAALMEVAREMPDDPTIVGGAADDRLAQRLIARGLLNQWQIEQLRAGRTKFTLGPYLIVDAIGKGGMGHVFKGRHELLGRIEAIKVLPKSRSTQQSIANFQHEIRAQAQLDHPNLVRVSYADKDGDTYFLVTEYVPGVDLRRLVRRCGALSPDQAAWIIAQAADALEYAHRRGLVHRDVKPGNLLLRPDGVVKVTDLGLAWCLEDSFGAAPGGSGKVVGTCDYLAPESIIQPDRIVPVSDVYALGCTLYYAVTGKVPFPGGNAAEKMRRQKHDEPIGPRAFNNQLPLPLADLIAGMMAKDHRERTASAAIVAERLRHFVRDDTVETLSKLIEQYTPSARGNTRPENAGVDVGETLESLTVEGMDAPSEASGQVSQGTEPVADSLQETTSEVGPQPVPLGQPETPRRGDWIVWGISIAALCASLAILLAAWFKAG